MEADSDKQEPPLSNKKMEPTYFTNFLKVVGGKQNLRVAIFTHANPDPDAIGSIMAMEWLLHKCYSHDCIGFFSGHYSHPQNITMVNLLDPNMRPIGEYKADDFDLRILVDTVPANAGVGDHTVSFDVVVDHHKEIPNGGFSGVFVNTKAGSCCGTVYHLIKKLNLTLEHDNDIDAKLATAILVGVSTDTESLMSDDTTNFEFEAWSDLFEYRDPVILKKIVHFERPKFWIDHKGSAVKNVVIAEGLGVVGLGVIPGHHRDMIADMADEMVTWEEVNTAIAFAVVDGEKVVGSVRSRNASVMVPILCKNLAGNYGGGGGKLGKGAYNYTLGGVCLDKEEDDDITTKTWDLLKEKETRRIFRVVKK